MARPRRRRAAQAPGVTLTPGQAGYVLSRLVAERRVSQSELSAYVNEMHREITALQERLEMLRAASGGGAAAPARRRGRPPAATRAAATAAPAGRRRRSAITPEQLASRQLQGRYLGLIRQIPASRRGQYQRIAKEHGREAAVKAMSDALKK